MGLFDIFRKSKNEEQEVKEILEANSINLDERIINMVIYLKKKKKELFCRVYNISSTDNVDILKFIAKNWVSSSDIHKDEMAGLFLSLKFINGRYPKSHIFGSLKSSMPKSLIHKVLVKDNYICQKCGKNLLSTEIKEELLSAEYIDLIKPLSEGGTLTVDNLITVCKQSCEEHFVPTKVIYDIYENSNLNSIVDTLDYKNDRLSFEYPDYYQIANIPDNCPDCAVALARKDGKCDIMIQCGDNNYGNNFNIFKYHYKEYVESLDNFFDIKEIEIKKIRGINYDDFENQLKACFIAICELPNDSKVEGLIKSIIYMDYNHSPAIRITLNSLLEDDYNCMKDLFIIANTLDMVSKFDTFYDDYNIPNF